LRFILFMPVFSLFVLTHGFIPKPSPAVDRDYNFFGERLSRSVLRIIGASKWHWKSVRWTDFTCRRFAILDLRAFEKTVENGRDRIRSGIALVRPKALQRHESKAGNCRCSVPIAA
jgi:hypothetical protein